MQPNGIVEIIVPYIIMMYAYEMGHYNGRGRSNNAHNSPRLH